VGRRCKVRLEDVAGDAGLAQVVTRDAFEAMTAEVSASVAGLCTAALAQARLAARRACRSSRPRGGRRAGAKG
jgi:hypothetical protein